jgi:beta-phosphoglucomutase-like phosphatase (HAD superfamily)
MHELVIFDCDGMLVDSEVISNEVLAKMLTREGLPTTLRGARRDYQGLLLTDIRGRAEAKLGRSLPQGWLAKYEHERAEAFQHGLEPVVGAAQAVR